MNPEEAPPDGAGWQPDPADQWVLSQMPWEEIADSPTREEVFALLRSDVTRSYRIDVESDSTIRADLTRSQETMTKFMQSVSQFIAAVGPAVQSSRHSHRRTRRR
jgi:hypothetical protein